MAFLISKSYYFVLDGRAVSRSCSLDHSGIQRGTVKVCTNDLVCFFVCVGKPAGFLLDLHAFRVCEKRERYNSLITKLFFHLGIVDGISCDSCRCSCLETEHFDSKFLE